MFVKLEVLELQPETQKRIVDLIPGIESVAAALGDWEFCFDKSEEYQDTDSEDGAEHSPQDILSKVKGTSTRAIWVCTSLVAAALNTKATYSIAPEGMGDSTRLILAVLASAVFVLIADLLIARELSSRLTRRDALREKTFLNEQMNQNGGVLKHSFYEGFANGFRNIQGNYAQRNQVTSTVTLGFLSFYFVVEFVASAMRETMLGDDFSLFSIAAPSLGMLLNIGTGYFNGVAIEYPKERRGIAKKYKKRFQALDKEGRLERKVSLINHVAALHVADPQLSAADLEKQRFERKFANEFKGIRKAYDSELVDLKKIHRDEEKALRQRLRQEPDARVTLQVEIGEQKDVLMDRTLDTLQRYRDELEVLQQEIESCSYNLSMDGVGALIDNLMDREDTLIAKREQLSRQKKKQAFSVELKDVCNRFESDFSQEKDSHRVQIKALKQSARANTQNREESQLELNACEKEYLEDCIQRIQMFQSELKVLRAEMDEAGCSPDVVESAYEGSERQQLLLGKKLETIQQAEVALDLNAQFEQARDRFNHTVTDLRQQQKEAIAQIAGHRKRMVVDEENERRILVESNACNRKYQMKILKAFEEYGVELNQLKEAMDKVACSTDMVKKVIGSVENNLYYEEEKLEKFREEEKGLIV